MSLIPKGYRARFVICVCGVCIVAVGLAMLAIVVLLNRPNVDLIGRAMSLAKIGCILILCAVTGIVAKSVSSYWSRN